MYNEKKLSIPRKLAWFTSRRLFLDHFLKLEHSLGYLVFHPQPFNSTLQLAALQLFGPDMAASFTLVLFQQKWLRRALCERWHPITFGGSEFADVNYIVLSVINLITEASDDCDLLLKTDRILWTSQQWTYILIKQWIYSIFWGVMNLKVSNNFDQCFSEIYTKVEKVFEKASNPTIIHRWRNWSPQGFCHWS